MTQSPGSPRGRRPGQVPGPEIGVYVISVAAELTGLHPQTLRTYDRLGLVSPGRTGGGGRRYSLRDIELLREVAELTRSEERRVGKECRSRWSPDPEKKNHG